MRIIGFAAVTTGALLAFTAPLAALPELALTSNDVVVEEGADGGFHIWIRTLPKLGSVLLTESSADPAKRVHSYALRSPRYNSINGQEQRVLQSVPLPPGLHSIVDSTTETHSQLGRAFHLFVPYVVEYGYSWTGGGELEVTDGTFLNIRTFEREFADYDGPYRDNPFVLRVVQDTPPPAPEAGVFNAYAVESFAAIADDGGGTWRTSSGQADVLEQLNTLLTGARGESLDLVLALDTTKSMEDDLPHLQASLHDLVASHVDRFAATRIGLLLYRDYAERYLVQPLPFMELTALQPALDRIKVEGGRDIPEAVYEALDASVRGYDWQADARQVVLIGDAPPHPRPRGAVTREAVFAAAREQGVQIHTIILESS